MARVENFKYITVSSVLRGAASGIAGGEYSGSLVLVATII